MINSYSLKKYLKSTFYTNQDAKNSILNTTKLFGLAVLFAFTSTANAQDPCAAVNVPYTVPLSTAPVPQLPQCITKENVNADNKFWETTAGGSGIGGNVMIYNYSASQAANDWFYTRKLNLTAGTSYRLIFKYRISSFAEKLKVAVGTSATASAMTQILTDLTIPGGFSGVQNKQIDFTVATTGVYNVGFQAYSDAFANTLEVGEISLTATPTCVVPTNIVFDLATVTQTGFAFSWTAPSSVASLGYDYEIRTSGAAGSGATGLADSGSVAAGITTATATGLTAGTSYKVYVRAKCAADDNSAWIESASFATVCSTVSIPYTLPLASVTVPNLPLCVTIENVNNDDKVWKTASSVTGIQGPVMHYIYNTAQAANDWFYTAALNLTAGTTYRLSYKYKISAFEEKLKVAIGTAPSAVTMTQVLSDITIPATQSAAVQEQFDFTVATTGVYFVGYQAKSAADKNSLYVGEVSVILGPNCFAPTGVIVTNLDKTSTTIAWGAPTAAPANGYTYEIRTSGAAGSGATGLVVTGTTAAGVTTADIAGLTADTTYNLYVRSNCGTDDQSNWSEIVTFITLCDYLEIVAVNDTTCVGSTAILQVTGATTEVNWYESDSSTEVLVTGPIFETPELLQTRSYWASTTVGTCTAPSRTEVVATVNEVPVITGDNVQTVTVDAAEDASLANLEPSGANINWFPTAADAIAFTNELEIGTQLNSGTTYYAVLTENDCRSLPFAVLVTVTLGLENQTMTGLTYFPNPVQDKLNIAYSENITSVVLFNLVGQQVMTITHNATEVVLDMSKVAVGTYMMQVNTNTASKMIKLIKK